MMDFRSGGRIRWRCVVYGVWGDRDATWICREVREVKVMYKSTPSISQPKAPFHLLLIHHIFHTHTPWRWLFGAVCDVKKYSSYMVHIGSEARPLKDFDVDSAIDHVASSGDPIASSAFSFCYS